MRHLLGWVGAGAVGLGVATSAMAETRIEFDINDLQISTDDPSDGNQAGPAFGIGFTGTLFLVADSDTRLASIRLNGADQGVNVLLDAFVGEIHIVANNVAGGFFSFTEGGDTYSASIVSGVGSIVAQTQGFSIDGLTFQGMFSGPSFAGVDVSAFFGAQPLQGDFTSLHYNPATSGLVGFDEDGDMEIGVVIPLPQSSLLAAAPLLGLVAIRRRRVA